jgi:MFS family permease
VAHGFNLAQSKTMKMRIIFWSITSALAGFLFGFDTVVISGAEQKIQSLWNLNPGLHGIVMAAALYGTVVGSVLGGWPTDRFGRKITLTFVGMLYIISAFGCAFAWDASSFVVARLIGGLGIGISTVAAPLYISEIAPAAYRGRLAGMFQFNIVFGILVAYVSNALLADIGDNAWRWMFGVAAVPSVIYTVLCLGLPESPRWLIGRKGDRQAGLGVLKLIEPDANPAQIETLADRILAASSERAVASRFWTWKLRIPIILAFLIAFFNQLSGINAILYFAPRIFGLTGSESAFSQTIGIGITNLIFTFVGLWLIDRLGRRTLMFIGSYGYIVSLGLCAAAFFNWSPQFKAASAAVDVKSAVKSLHDANPARVAALEKELEVKKSALVDATSVAASGAQPVSFSTGESSDAVNSAADQALLQSSKAAGSGGFIVLICIFAFIAAHAVGQGAVIWVFISEIFPNRHRAEGQAFGSATHWVFAALLTSFFPLAMAALAPGFVFLIFCGMMVLQLIWVAAMMPETKGVPLEDMQKRLDIE